MCKQPFQLFQHLGSHLCHHYKKKDLPNFIKCWDVVMRPDFSVFNLKVGLESFCDKIIPPPVNKDMKSFHQQVRTYLIGFADRLVRDGIAFTEESCNLDTSPQNLSPTNSELVKISFYSPDCLREQLKVFSSSNIEALRKNCTTQTSMASFLEAGLSKDVALMHEVGEGMQIEVSSQTIPIKKIKQKKISLFRPMMLWGWMHIRRLKNDACVIVY